MRLPLTRPVLPRISSGTSGFFFCGMIDEPVQKRSARSTNAKRGFIQMMISSQKRERCVITSAPGGAELDREVAIGHRVEGIFAQAVEPELLGNHHAVDRKRRPGERRASQRQPVDPLAAVGQSLRVTREHFEVSHQMVRVRDRLCHLQCVNPGMMVSVWCSARSSSDRCAALIRSMISSIAARR
jgi:hypothetical protein